MARRTSSGPEVLLGLLTIEPMSGYDLGQLIQTSIRLIWNESYGQIYPNLKRLAAGGFITGKSEKQKGKPDRQIYSITPRGRERLARWLQVEPQPEVPRNELLLKMFFGSKATPQAIEGYVRRMAVSERAVLDRLKALELELAAGAHYPDAPYWGMVLRFGQLELKAHQQWAAESIAALQKLARPRRLSATKKEKPHARK